MGQVLRLHLLMFLIAGNISLWQRIEEWDRWLFIRLNSRWTNSFFDVVLPWFRNSVFWAPLYLFIFVFIVMNFGKKGLWWCVFFLCTVAITDLLGTRVFKEGFERLRPCNDPGMMFYVRLLLGHCSDSYSFVSNHAANHFGIAAFAVFTFKGMFKKWLWLSFAWAFIIGYAQVYVGLHYPLDVVGGTVLGILTGSLTAWAFRKKWGSFEMNSI